MGTLRLITAWPFPGEEIEKMARKAKHVIVMENNLGQMYPYVKAEAAHFVEVSFLPPRWVGEIHIVANLIILGALMKRTGLLPIDAMEKAIEMSVSKKAKTLNLNAFRRGLEMM